MTPRPNDPAHRHVPSGSATPNRRGRLTKSRAIAAGASVGALVLVTAGIATANPAKNTSSGTRAGGGTNANRQTPKHGGEGDDSGWQEVDPNSSGSGDGGQFSDNSGGFGSDGGQFSDNSGGFQDPSSGGGGFQQVPSGGFDPGFGSGGGHSSSGGS